MFYIKEGVIFKAVENSSQHGTKVSTIKVRLGIRATTGFNLHIYMRANKTHDQRSTYPK